MKKSLSLILALVMLVSMAVPAFAKPIVWTSQSKSDIPIIRISGDGDPLVDENGNDMQLQKLDYETVMGMIEDAWDGCDIQ